MSKRKIGIAAVVLVLLIAGGVWAIHKSRADAQVEKVKQMQDEMFAGGPPKPDDFDRMRKEMDKLSPDQQRQVRDHGRRNFQRRNGKSGSTSTSPRRRRSERKSWTSTFRTWRKCGRRWRSGGRRVVDHLARREADRTRSERAAAKPPAKAARREAPAGAGGGGGSNRTAQGQSERRNSMLDNTSPAQRANMAAYFSALQQRRMELGLPAFPGPMGGGPRWTLTTSFDEDHS